MADINIALSLFALVITLIVFFSCLIERIKRETKSNGFVLLLAFISLALMADTVGWIGEGRPSLWAMTVIGNVAASCAGYLAIFSFIVYLKENLFVQSRPVSALVIVFAVLCLLSVMGIIINGCYGNSYIFDSNGHYIHDHTFPMPLIYLQFPFISFVTVSLMVVLAKGASVSDRIFYFLYVLFPTIGVTVDYFVHGLSLTYLGMVVSAMMIYTNIHLQRRRLIAEQRNALMMSQINPHFIYNTLTAIASLCEIDPKRARALTVEFSSFLRQNLDTLTATELIPFEREMAHVRSYLKIEKERFKDKLNVNYKISDEDFSLPPLTIQPLVENAVKHGITKKTGGGTICISTWTEGRFHVVEIKDDGIGFDPEAPSDAAKTHYGLENVRGRLRAMCRGTLEVRSKTDVGTRVTVRIPVKKARRGETR